MYLQKVTKFAHLPKTLKIRSIVTNFSLQKRKAKNKTALTKIHYYLLTKLLKYNTIPILISLKPLVPKYIN